MRRGICWEKIEIPRSNSGRVPYIQFRTNTLWVDMNPSLFPYWSNSRLGSIAMAGNWSKRKNTLNSKEAREGWAPSGSLNQKHAIYTAATVHVMLIRPRRVTRLVIFLGHSICCRYKYNNRYLLTEPFKWHSTHPLLYSATFLCNGYFQITGNYKIWELLIYSPRHLGYV